MRTLFILLIVLLAGCFPVGTPTTPPPPTEPPPSVNLLENPSFEFVPGDDFNTPPYGTLCVLPRPWWALDYQNPTAAFFCEPKSNDTTPYPWNGYLVDGYAQEMKWENTAGHATLMQAGADGITVARGVSYHIQFEITPLIFANVPASWANVTEALVAQAAPDWVGAPLDGWEGMVEWQIFVKPFNGGTPYAQSVRFNGLTVRSQTGRDSYRMEPGESIVLDTLWISDNTHCPQQECQIAVFLDMWVNEVNGVVPYLASIYVHDSAITPLQ